ncbi:LysR substrate-binding domain-containing protein [Pelagibius sp. 7325]|uniref:LysR substrate-binding domain-containing protein n=1 Tax=Pelagibius sp. 7325 TaxID=3131994 RepID=UPI0030ED40D6
MVDFRSLSLKHLRAFAATIRRGSVTQAAQALFVTPPAVTTHLKSLEKIVGQSIYERNPDGPEPTEVGRELLEAADEIEKVIERARVKIEALASGATGSVILGVVSTGKYFAPGIVARFRQDHPDIRVRLAIGNRTEIIKGLERREYDLLIMGRPPAHVAVEREVLGDHPHVLVAAPDHPLVGDPEILPEDLLRETFLAREEGSGTRLLMGRFLERIGGGRSFNTVEMGTNETIKQAVMAGLGIAIISAHTCHSELAEGKLALLQAEGLPLVRQWFLIHRADRELTKAAEVLRRFIVDHKGEILP